MISGSIKVTVIEVNGRLSATTSYMFRKTEDQGQITELDFAARKTLVDETSLELD